MEANIDGGYFISEVSVCPGCSLSPSYPLEDIDNSL